MIYAVSAAVVAAFLIVFALTLPKYKPSFWQWTEDEEFERQTDKLTKLLVCPKSGAKSQFARLKRVIKRAFFKLSFKRYDGIFDVFLKQKEFVYALLKNEPTSIEAMPSVDGEARAVILADFALKNSALKFDKGRVDAVLRAQNKLKTLSFVEIMALKDAFLYAAVKAIADIFCKLTAVAKVYDIAIAYLKTPYGTPKKYVKLTKSPLFLSLCALKLGYNVGYYAQIYKKATDILVQGLANALKSAEEAAHFDFSHYYTPLEILHKFDAFCGADAMCKTSFCNLLCKLADKENIDEFMLAARLEKYMQSASGGHVRTLRLGLPGRAAATIVAKKDISLLAACLGSAHYMSMFFGRQKRVFGRKSITKFVDFENSFEPIYRYNSLNFGISTTGGRLRISPNLPPSVRSATVCFEACGTQNTLHIVRGESKRLYLGDTLLTGTDEIHLGGRPLDVTLVIPENDGSPVRNFVYDDKEAKAFQE